ncbi:MAG: hypothetical protein IPK82_26235 [Polyangiaceae bacterium]|nr:hypothetical protein [Polyangiaceae bacterium]
MPSDLVVRFRSDGANLEVPAELVAVGAEARPAAEQHARLPSQGPRLLLTGDRDYFVALPANLPEVTRTALTARVGRTVLVVFPGRWPVRRRVAQVFGLEEKAPPPASDPIDLTEGREGAAPLWLLPSGRFSSTREGAQALDSAALVSAARWISSRRLTSFERLFAPSAFHPEKPIRTERLSAEQAQQTLAQSAEALQAATPTGSLAASDETAAAQLRSAALTVLSHLIATVLKDATFRGVADSAAAQVFALINAESGDRAKPMLRAHAIQLLQMRAPALSEADRQKTLALVKTLVRAAPPYTDLIGSWRFAMCSASEFHEGECKILENTYQFKEIPAPADAPKPPGYGGYRVFKAPFKTPAGDDILVFARSAMPYNENHEMGEAYFTGILINRHAQLGSYDMRAATANIKQAGYKLMMNSQCAGLTTRFAISRLFPDADILSSWDSTYFRNPSGNLVVASEGVDCFVSVLEGMAAKETHAQIEQRIRRVQWYHPQNRTPGFVQFIGPAHPLVVARYNDVNHDGKGDFYDGFLDLQLTGVAEDLYASATPKDPGVAASQISGEAATGVGWAAGSLNRVTQYSDIWSTLPGDSEGLYVFQSGGFYSHKEPPADVPMGSDVVEDLGLLPVVCRYSKSTTAAGLTGEVLFHSYLSHAAKELKRLLAAAEVMNRAFDLGYLPKEGLLSKPLGRRAALLLTLAGLLEYPADQNHIDGLWAMALKMLNLPDISRSVVRGCITEADHDASNYYGSRRGMQQLVGTGEGTNTGDLGRADPSAYERIKSSDVTVGRARPLTV